MGRYKFDIFLSTRFDRREILAENHAGKTGGRVRPVNMMGFYNFIKRVSIRSPIIAWENTVDNDTVADEAWLH